MSEIAEQRPETLSGPGGPSPQKNPWTFIRSGGALFIRQREATVFVVALVLVLYFGLSTSTFFSTTNLSNLLSGYAAPIIIIAIGEVLLLICGEIDLSVGFVYTFAPFFMHYMIDFYHVPGVAAILLTLLLGLAIGWINGFFTVTVGVPSFITTFGMAFILYGLILTTSHAYPASIPASVASIGNWIGGEAWAQIIWAVALVAIFHVVLTRTQWGLHTIAVGGNLLASTEAGINVARIKYGNFMICSFMGALVGIQVAFYDHTIDPSSGGFNPMFYSVAAAVIGGTAMLGGVGTIIGGFLGAIVLATVLDGFQIKGVSANPINIIFGLAILIAMIANVQLARLREAGRTR